MPARRRLCRAFVGNEPAESVPHLHLIGRKKRPAGARAGSQLAFDRIVDSDLSKIHCAKIMLILAILYIL